MIVMMYYYNVDFITGLMYLMNAAQEAAEKWK
jgi:hypothetical protein